MAPGSNVSVFIDGWNLHRGCERAFGHGPIHPLLLGRQLAGERRLESVHYYIGVPDHRVEAENAQIRTRQLDLMSATGVDVTQKKLRYRWEWKLDKRSLPHPARHQGETLEATAVSKNQGREKGVDVALALDAFFVAQDPNVDVVIIVSADTDLDLVPLMVQKLPKSTGARVENAIVNRHGKKIINRHFAWSHQIDKHMFNAIRDETDYRDKMTKKRRRELATDIIGPYPRR